MADLEDVLVALRDEVGAALSVAGLLEPGPGIGGTKVYVGWPSSEALDADLKAQRAHVTVFPRAGVGRVLGPRLGRNWDVVGPAPAGFSAVVDEAAGTVTFSGSAPPAPAVSTVAVVVDRRFAYAVAAGPTDTPESVAAVLAVRIQSGLPPLAGFEHDAGLPGRAASAAGPVLTVPGAFALEARVAASRPERRELDRVAQGVAVTVWAPSTELRRRLTEAVHVALAEDDGRTLMLPGGEVAGVRYVGTVLTDELRAQPLRRRDLLLEVDFSVVRDRADVPPVVAPVADADGAPGLVVDGG